MMREHRWPLKVYIYGLLTDDSEKTIECKDLADVPLQRHFKHRGLVTLVSNRWNHSRPHIRSNGLNDPQAGVLRISSKIGHGAQRARALASQFLPMGYLRQAMRLSPTSLFRRLDDRSP